jgi:molybdenum cofactor biosynthesis enzyme MoaA
LVEFARFECKFRSLLLITNGTLLDRKPRILNAVTGLVVSLDALSADPANPLSKPAALPKVLENLQFAKKKLGSPRRITISTVIEEWNIGQVAKLLDWCGEQGFVFAAQSAQLEKMPNLGLPKGVSVLPDDVSTGISQWRCVLSLRAVAENRREYFAGRLAAKDFRAGEEAARRYSAVSGCLLFVRERSVALLRE